MKLPTKLTAALTCLLIPLAAFAVKPATTGATNYQVQMAPGQLHCGDCAKKVSEALKSLPDVEKGSVKVVLAKNTATLQIKKDSKVTAEQIKNAIESKTKYTVSTVEEIQATTPPTN